VPTGMQAHPPPGPLPLRRRRTHGLREMESERMKRVTEIPLVSDDKAKPN
jgi:hypothetical protein